MPAGSRVLDDYVRKMRLLSQSRRTYQRKLYRPAELLRFDVYEPKAEVPVGHG
jgi:hypothetical protein